MAELKPCPFCGGDGSLNIRISSKIVFGSCWECGARGSVIQYKGDRPMDYHLQEAIEAWNKRAINDNNYYKKQSSCTTLDGKEWFASGGGNGK